MTEAVIHRYGADPAQFGELSLPDGPPLGTVVVLHGGFWGARYDLSLGRPLAADLAARGYAAWNLEYRRCRQRRRLAGHLRGRRGRDRPARHPAGRRVPGGRHRAQRGRAPRGVGGGASRRCRTARPGARPAVAVTGVISQGGVLGLADCARDRLGEDAAIKLMGGGPDELPEPYRLADPMTWLPSPASVVCLHSRADQRVPYSYSERYVAADAGGGRPGAPGGDVRRPLHADRPGHAGLGGRGRRAAGAAGGMRVASDRSVKFKIFSSNGPGRLPPARCLGYPLMTWGDDGPETRPVEQAVARRFGQDGSSATAANRPDGRAARWEKNSPALVLVSMPMSWTLASLTPARRSWMRRPPTRSSVQWPGPGRPEQAGRVGAERRRYLRRLHVADLVAFGPDGRADAHQQVLGR